MGGRARRTPPRWGSGGGAGPGAARRGHGPPMTYLGGLPPILAELQRGGGQTPGWRGKGATAQTEGSPSPSHFTCPLPAPPFSKNNSPCFP